MFRNVAQKVSVALNSGLKLNTLQVSAKTMSTDLKFETLDVSFPKPYVCHVALNRPKKLNAQSQQMTSEIAQCLEKLNSDENCRAIVMSGSGKMFCAGMDIGSFMSIAPKLQEETDVARRAKILHSGLVKYQKDLTWLENCSKPVIAAVHNGCIGAGVDLISAADIRYCSKDAWFSIKEVLIGMAADVGTLQRFPKIVGNDSLTRELCYTGRKFDANEAIKIGFVSQIFENKDACVEGAINLAEQIARNSPVAVQLTKKSLIYSRDHSVQEGLDHIGSVNQFMLQSEDFAIGTASAFSKDTDDIVYSKL